jgi:hypothetical protein
MDECFKDITYMDMVYLSLLGDSRSLQSVFVSCTTHIRNHIAHAANGLTSRAFDFHAIFNVVEEIQKLKNFVCEIEQDTKIKLENARRNPEKKDFPLLLMDKSIIGIGVWNGIERSNRTNNAADAEEGETQIPAKGVADAEEGKIQVPVKNER